MFVSEICKSIIVSNAAYANCDGEYQYIPDEKVSWAPNKPVYKELVKDRYMFWTDGKGFGSQWVIGGTAELTSGSYYQSSTLYSMFI